MAGERTFRGKTPDERRAERRGKLLEAALDLMASGGWRTATMTAICQRAGLTERYFYESFRDRDALYVELIYDLAADVQRAVLDAAAVDAPDARTRLRAVVEQVLGVFAADPRRGYVAFLEGLDSPTLQHRRRDSLLGFERLVRDQAPAVFGENAPTGLAIELGAASLVGAAGELLTRRLNGTLTVTDEQLADHLVELAEGWLTISTASVAATAEPLPRP